MARRSNAHLVSVLLALVAFVLTHQAVFLYTYGRDFEAALSRTGHGSAWAVTVVLVLALGAGLSLVGAAELARLARLAHRARLLDRDGLTSVLPAREDSIRSLATETLRTTGGIAGGVALLLVLTENVEHALAGAALPGIGVFDGLEYQGSLPILLAFSLAVAAVRALYRWRRSSLVARLRAAPALPHPPFGSLRRPAGARIPRSALIGRRLAGRAPPVVAAA